MLLYHFTTAQHGLDDIDRRRLKIATIQDLNDPFELLCVDLSDERVRLGMNRWKAGIAEKYGMLCFSKTWGNPVQWSHYAQKNTGLCLGFNVADESLFRVTYSKLRSVEEANHLIANGTGNIELMRKFLSTKFSHWRYEQEYRVFVDLVDIDPVTKMHYCYFNEKMTLARVIIGAHSDVERAQVAAVLKDYEQPIQVINARLAFRQFKVVTQHDRRLWA